MTHWVTVHVQVPVRTEHPSPMKAEQEAKKLVEAALQNAAPKMTVSAWQWSRSEP